MNPQVDLDDEDVNLVGNDSFFEIISEGNYYQMARDTVRSARWLYHASKVWANLTTYMGIETMKFPTDMWIMQELIHEIKLDVLIETGTWKGGSALYYAHLMDAMGHGEVITIDNDPKDDLPKHQRIHYLVGDCLSDKIVDIIKGRLDGKWRYITGPVLVNLDSAHKKEHVLKEMEIYSQFVTDGSYMVVEDGIVGHPVMINDKDGNPITPGPYEAINEFIKNHPEFECDREKEKFQVIANVKGYLKKIRKGG